MQFQNFGFNSTAGSFVTNGLRIYVDATNATSYVGSGSTWTDLSGFGNNLTISASFTSSPIRTFQFRNTSIQNRASASYTATAEFTCEVWVNWITSSTGLFSRLTSFGPSDNYEQAIQPTGRYNYYNDGGGWDTTVTNPLFVSGSWTQMLATRSGSTYTMYKDGALVRTDTLNSPVGGNLFCVGNRYKSEPAIPTEGIQGDISIVRMYNRALTAAEVLINYNADKVKFGL